MTSHEEKSHIKKEQKSPVVVAVGYMGIPTGDNNTHLDSKRQLQNPSACSSMLITQVDPRVVLLGQLQASFKSLTTVAHLIHTITVPTKEICNRTPREQHGWTVSKYDSFAIIWLGLFTYTLLVKCESCYK